MKLTSIAGALSSLILLCSLTMRAQQAGKFDYYLLSLSWSPEYCYSHQGSPECSKHLGLIVHGLWPEYNGGNRGPEDCGQQRGPSNPESLLDIIPTTSLVEHEWSTHGTCSGLGAADYFGLLRRAFSSLHVPSQLQNARRSSVVGIAELKQAFVQANPGMNASEIALTCRGRYLSEVQICLTKDGKPQPCSDLRECRGSSVTVSAIK